MAVPLADRMRPKTLDEIVGQRHLFGEGCVLRNIIESGRIPNLIFYGPSGTGKTTVARIIAASAKKRLHILNGTSASLNDVRDVIGYEVDMQIARWVLGEDQLTDESWDHFRSVLEEGGLQEFLSIWQEVYDATKAEDPT